MSHRCAVAWPPAARTTAAISSIRAVVRRRRRRVGPRGRSACRVRRQVRPRGRHRPRWRSGSQPCSDPPRGRCARGAKPSQPASRARPRSSDPVEVRRAGEQPDVARRLDHGDAGVAPATGAHGVRAVEMPREDGVADQAVRHDRQVARRRACPRQHDRPRCVHAGVERAPGLASRRLVSGGEDVGRQLGVGRAADIAVVALGQVRVDLEHGAGRGLQRDRGLARPCEIAGPDCTMPSPASRRASCAACCAPGAGRNWQLTTGWGTVSACRRR